MPCFELGCNLRKSTQWGDITLGFCHKMLKDIDAAFYCMQAVENIHVRKLYPDKAFWR